MKQQAKIQVKGAKRIFNSPPVFRRGRGWSRRNAVILPVLTFCNDLFYKVLYNGRNFFVSFLFFFVVFVS